MQYVIDGSTCKVTREPGDPRFRDGGWGTAESQFLHHLKLALKAHGIDYIKKRMWKDGHLVDDEQQYLRMRRPARDGSSLAIYSPFFAIEDAGKRFNRTGEVRLAVACL